MKILEQIEQRKSIREYKNKELSDKQIAEIQEYFADVPKLTPDTAVELRICTGDAKVRLEGIAGYQGKAFGAPAYLILLSEKADYYLENAGFIGESLILKLTDMELDNCWLTLDDSNAAKNALQITSDKEIVTIIACGYGKRERKLQRLDIKNPSNVTFTKREGHVAPKIAQHEMVYLNEWDQEVDWSENMIDPLLDTSFYAASLAPSMLNRQPYRYVLQQRRILLFVKKEELISETDTLLDAGATMLNFHAAFTDRNTTSQGWTLGPVADPETAKAPEDWHLVASYIW